MPLGTLVAVRQFPHAVVMTPTLTISRTTRTTAALLALGVSALAACGGTTQTSAGSAPPTIDIATTTPATVPDTAALTVPETTVGPTPPPAPAPRPTPAPTPAPTPTPTTPPPPPPPAPVPEPVQVPLLEALSWDISGSRDDGAGGSAETKQVGSSGVGLRAYAWHGYNGSGTARATATTTFDASPYLTTEVPVARVELQFAASGSGVLKAPWDRSARIWVDAASRGQFSEGEQLHTFIDVSLARDTEANSDLDYGFDSGSTHSFLVTPEHPTVGFTFDAICTAAGGPRPLALLNEGYCDFYEQGGLQLDSLSVVVTPLPGYDIVDGQPVG